MDIEQEKKDEALEDLIAHLRSFARAYPEEIFTPLTDEESKRMGSLLDRASAGMGRHLAQYFTKAADALDNLQFENDRLRQELEEQKQRARRESMGTL